MSDIKKDNGTYWDDRDFELGLSDKMQRLIAEITSGGADAKPNGDDIVLSNRVRAFIESELSDAAKPQPAPPDSEFRSELKQLINRHSMENGSNTPDHILADYLLGCLRSFDQATQARDRGYDVVLEPGRVRLW